MDWRNISDEEFLKLVHRAPGAPIAAGRKPSASSIPSTAKGNADSRVADSNVPVLSKDDAGPVQRPVKRRLVATS